MGRQDARTSQKGRRDSHELAIPRRSRNGKRIDVPDYYAEATSIRSQFALNCIDIEGASDVEGAVWESFQIDIFNDDSRLSHFVKSRQIAFSFTVAAEAWIDSLLFRQSSIFVSINQDEAKEKIRYVRRLYESTHRLALPEIVRDNEFSIGFSNGTLIESMPSKAARGKARRNVYLDEFAHVAKDKEIYRGSIPVISKGGRLRIGSSPMGARGVFWEIGTEFMRPYPGFRRLVIPWWDVRAFCNDTGEARRLAPHMLTAERVAMFGTDTLRLIFENTVLEDFQQEYECEFVDEVASWISWDEIKRNQDENLTCLSGEYTMRSVGEARRLVDRLLELLQRGEIEYALAGGVDIGRTRNTTEIFLGGVSTTGAMPLRLAITLNQCEFEDQKGLIAYILDTLPVHTILIDKNGLGMNLAEDLERSHPMKARGFEFTAPSKKVLASDAKMFFQQGRAPIPYERDLAYQIHSIRRRVSGSGIFIFDVDASEKHHADKFWALALMLHAIGGRRTMSGRVSVRTA